MRGRKTSRILTWFDDVPSLRVKVFTVQELNITTRFFFPYIMEGKFKTTIFPHDESPP